MIRRLVLLVVVISLAVRLAGAPREADSEPDPTITRWLATLRDEDETLRRSAAYSLKDPGSAAMNAVLTLVAALQDGDAFVRRAVATALGEIRREPAHAVPALVNALRDADPGVREHAAIALAKIGLPAVPSLIELLGETNLPGGAGLRHTNARLADFAAVSLAVIGPPAVPALIEAVRAGKKHARVYARFVVNRAGKGAYPALLDALKDEHVGVHSFAVAALAGSPRDAVRTGPIPGDVRAVPILNRLLRSPDKVLRRDAANALAAIGPDAVPTLIAALQDGDPAVRLQACTSLGQVEAAEPLVVTALALAVKDPNVDVRREAVRVLRELHNLGPSAKAAVPALAAALTDAEPEVRWAAAHALSYYGPEAAAGVPALTAAVGDQDEDVRRAAIEALASMGAQAVESIPTLIRALQDESVVSSAATTLGKLGTPARPAIPELQRAVKGAKERRWEVLSALGDLRAGDDGSIAVLTEALADPDPDVRQAAASSLAKIGPAAAPAVPALIRTLEQGSFANSAVVEALAGIGPTAIPDLIEALTDPSEAIRSGTARALAPMGKVDPRVVPALVTALDDPSPAVRFSAAQSLGQIGGTANVSALVRTMRDPVSSVRAAAAKALGAIGSDAAAARPTLSDALRDVDAEVRAEAVDALGKVGVEGTEGTTWQLAVEGLIQQLKHTDLDIRQEAENRLRQVGAQAGRLLIEALDDSDPHVGPE